MLPRLIDEGRGQQFRRIELADRESIKPCFLPAGQALKLRAAYVPEFDVDTVRPALAEEQDRYGRQCTA